MFFLLRRLSADGCDANAGRCAKLFDPRASANVSTFSIDRRAALAAKAADLARPSDHLAEAGSGDVNVTDEAVDRSAGLVVRSARLESAAARGVVTGETSKARLSWLRRVRYYRSAAITRRMRKAMRIFGIELVDN